MNRIRNGVPEPVPRYKPPYNEAYEVTSDEDEYWGDVADILYDLRQRDIFRIRPIAEHISRLFLGFPSALQRQKMHLLQDTSLTCRPSKARVQEYEGVITCLLLRIMMRHLSDRGGEIRGACWLVWERKGNVAGR
jgi:hypothetical protein